MMYQKNFYDIFPGIFRITKGNPSALCLYLYIAHHYCMTKSTKIRLTYDEIADGTDTDFGTGLSKNTIGRAIKVLQKAKLLKVKRSKYRKKEDSSNLPRNVNYYRPMCPDSAGKKTQDFEQFTHTPNLGTSDDSNGPKKAMPNGPKLGSVSCIKNKKQGLVSGFYKNGLLPDKVPTKQLDKYNQAALRLKDSLGRKNVVMRRKVNIQAWTKTLREFVEDSEGMSWVRFKKVLKWYCNNIKGKHVPWAFSAESFCDKFNNIEGIMMSSQEYWSPEDPEAEPPTQQELSEAEEQELREIKAHKL